MLDGDRTGRASPTSRRRFIGAIAAAAVGSPAIAGCTRSEEEMREDELSGNIDISGSSTVYPVSTAMAELFNREYPEVDISISRDGTSAGFENAFIPGRSDVNDASRPITESEIQQCREQGFEPLEFLVARDALTIVVNNDNDWVECIDLETLAEIWSPDDPPETWADVDPDWPDEELDLYGPASTSGTFDYFTKNVVGEAGKIRDDFEGTEEDDLIAQGVDGNRYAMGYLPFAYYTNNPEETTALSLSAGDAGCVEPSLANAKSGDYGLARPLFVYVNSERLAEKPHLEAFLRFYMKNSTREDLLGELIGYVPNSEEIAQENLRTIDEYTG